jgi:hypothetical protein
VIQQQQQQRRQEQQQQQHMDRNVSRDSSSNNKSHTRLPVNTATKQQRQR